MSASRSLMRTLRRRAFTAAAPVSRLPRRQAVRFSSTLQEPTVPKPSFALRLVKFLGVASIGFVGGLTYALPWDVIKQIRNPPSHADTLTMFEPGNADAKEKEDYINSLPLVAQLRANPELIESRPHLRMPDAWRQQNLTAGTLMGPGLVTVPPFSWHHKQGLQYVQISHAGTDMCGHKGVIHGGFLATMLDEGLARCCFPVLPYHIGMTAQLDITYKKPAMANQYLVLRGRTVKVDGRKAWVEGHIETLPTKEGEEPVVLAEAKALFISPRQAAAMAKLYPVTD